VRVQSREQPRHRRGWIAASIFRVLNWTFGWINRFGWSRSLKERSRRRLSSVRGALRGRARGEPGPALRADPDVAMPAVGGVSLKEIHNCMA